MKKNHGMTVGEWVNEYLRDYVYPVCKPSAAEHYADNLQKHLLPALGKLPLDELTAPVLQQFLNEQSRTGNLKNHGPLSVKSLRNLRTAVSACLTQAVSLGILPSNPVPGTVIRRASRVVVETMSEADRDVLLKFLVSDSNLMNPAIIFAAELGLRRGELCALRWMDLDANGCLHISNTVKRLKCLTPDSKTRTALVFGPVKSEESHRVLALSPFLLGILDLQEARYRDRFGEPGPEDFIFYNAAGNMTDPDNLSHYFSDVLAGLKLPHVKLHALRHTFATRAVELGIDIGTVSGLLGHSDVATTSHYYLHPRQQAMNNALWQLASAEGAAPVASRSFSRAPQAPHEFRRRAGFPEVETAV